MKKLPDKRQKPSKTNQWASYMGMASQMIGIILLGAFAGRWLDNHFQLKQSYFTAVISLIAVFFALWYALKDLIIKK